MKVGDVVRVKVDLPGAGVRGILAGELLQVADTSRYGLLALEDLHLKRDFPHASWGRGVVQVEDVELAEYPAGVPLFELGIECGDGSNCPCGTFIERGQPLVGHTAWLLADGKRRQRQLFQFMCVGCAVDEMRPHLARFDAYQAELREKEREVTNARMLAEAIVDSCDTERAPPPSEK